MLVGYMRVSSADDRQTVDLQRDALVAAGVDERHLHTDKASGARDDRRRLRLARPLKVDRLAIVGRRDPHISNQHVRQTPESTFSNTLSKRQGLSNVMTEGGVDSAKAKTGDVVNHVFSDSLKTLRQPIPAS